MALSFGPTKAEATDYFFHCPRTGGNYTIRAIRHLRISGEPAYKKHRVHMHAAPPDVRPGTLNVGRSFAIVRPPLDWYRSFYRFRIVKHFVHQNLPPSHPLDKYIWGGQYRDGGFIFPFDGFVHSVQLDYPGGFLTKLYGRFMDHVDEVLSTDQLTVQLPALLAKWGYDEPIWLPDSRKNVTTDPGGGWAPPKAFKKWTADGAQINELPVDVAPGTVAIMEHTERRIIEKLRRIGI